MKVTVKKNIHLWAMGGRGGNIFRQGEEVIIKDANNSLEIHSRFFGGKKIDCYIQGESGNCYPIPSDIKLEEYFYIKTKKEKQKSSSLVVHPLQPTCPHKYHESMACACGKCDEETTSLKDNEFKIGDNVFSIPEHLSAENVRKYMVMASNLCLLKGNSGADFYRTTYIGQILNDYLLELRKSESLTYIEKVTREEREQVIEKIEKRYNVAMQSLHTEFPPRFSAGGGLVGRKISQREQKLRLEIDIYGKCLQLIDPERKSK